MVSKSQNEQPHITIINHSDEVLSLMRELLEEEGYRVTAQHMFEGARKQIEDEQPELVILDYMWEVDNSGWSLLQELRLSRKTLHIPIIVCTAAVNRAQELAPHFERMGIRVILKPFDIDTIISEVDAHIGGARAGLPQE